MYRINKSTKKSLFDQVAQIILDDMGDLFPEYDISIEVCANSDNASVRYNEKYMQISIGTDLMTNPIWSRYHKSRFDKFLKGIDVPFNKYSIFALAILHEFGHVAHELSTGDTQYNQKMKIVNKSLSSIFNFNYYEDDTHNTEIRCSIYPAELFSDKFAYENFYPIWKRCLKETMP